MQVAAIGHATLMPMKFAESSSLCEILQSQASEDESQAAAWTVGYTVWLGAYEELVAPNVYTVPCFQRSIDYCNKQKERIQKTISNFHVLL